MKTSSSNPPIRSPVVITVGKHLLFRARSDDGRVLQVGEAGVRGHDPWRTEAGQGRAAERGAVGTAEGCQRVSGWRAPTKCTDHG